MAKLVNYISLNCREHSDGANLHQGKTSRGKFCHGGRNVWDTVVGGRCRKSRFLGETFISSPGLTLKRAPRSQSMAMAPLDRTHLLVFYNNFGRISPFLCYSRFYAEMTSLDDCDLLMTVKINPDYLQNKISLRLRQDLPLVKKFRVNPCITFCVRLHRDRLTDRLMNKPI